MISIKYDECKISPGLKVVIGVRVNHIEVLYVIEL